MVVSYPIILYRNEKGRYVGEAPDLPVCARPAKTPEKAAANLEAAACAYLLPLIEKGEQPPKASLPADIRPGAGMAEAAVREIRLDLGAYKKQLEDDEAAAMVAVMTILS